MKKLDQTPPEGYVFVEEGSLKALADNIQKIADAVKRFSGPGKLNSRALVTLLKEATRDSGRIVEESDIRKILFALQNLDSKFLTPKKGKK